MTGDETEVETLKVKVNELEAELETAKCELNKSRKEVEKGSKALVKTQRQLDKSNSYNDDLRQQIETLSREIQVFRDQRRDVQHVGVQAIAEEILTEQGEKPLPQWENGVSSVQEAEDKSSSIAESLKQTAEAALAESGYVFDDQTGLYYDYNSGYYYNCEQGLYYDPASGTYFYYDEASGEYTFHSQVAPQQYTCPTSQSGQNGEKTDRKRKKSKEKKKEERDSSDQKKRKKKKKEKEDKKKSKSRRKSSKKKSKKRKHRSHHKKGDNSVDSKSEVDVDVGKGSSHHKRDRHKHSRIDDECHTSEKIQKKGVKDGKSMKTKIKSQPPSSNKYDAMETQENSDNEDDVEMGEIVDSEDETVDNKTTEKALDDVVLSDGELSSNDLATGESELESGELTSDTEEDSSSSSSSESSEEEEVEEIVLLEEKQEDLSSNSWPPCIRVMVSESDCLPEGTLFIVTCDGATIGREKDMNHLIRIPDINVSKLHAEIQYDYDAHNYVIIDCGSQNGTFLNGRCISESKCERSVRALSHGDTLQLATTILLLHIHPGTDTCDDCEPGQVLSRLQAQEKTNREVVIKSKAERQKEQRQQLKQIKRRYGLENSAYVDDVSALKNPAYQDKAASRRREVGSDNPHVRDEAPASVMKPISTENKGRKLLAKMGWKEGQGLGKGNAGIAEPINVMLRTNQSAGLGSSSAIQKTLDDVHSVQKSQRWLQAQQRYKKLEKGPVDLSKPTNVSFNFRKGPTVSLEPKVDLGDRESNKEEGEEQSD